MFGRGFKPVSASNENRATSERHEPLLQNPPATSPADKSNKRKRREEEKRNIRGIVPEHYFSFKNFPRNYSALCFLPVSLPLHSRSRGLKQTFPRTSAARETPRGTTMPLKCCKGRGNFGRRDDRYPTR